MTRQEANIQILGLIAEAITKYPDRRFAQLLSHLNVIHTGPEDWNQNHIETIDFYEEPEITLKRILERINDGK